MCQDTPFVERPTCSSTSAHVVCDQPWPPCSTAWSPPLSPASIAAALMAAISSDGSRPPASSAATSRGISCSSTKRRARCTTSAWPVSATGVVVNGAPPSWSAQLLGAREPEGQGVVVGDDVANQRAGQGRPRGGQQPLRLRREREPQIVPAPRHGGH